MKNVQHFSGEVSSSGLLINQTWIELIDYDTGDVYQREIHSEERNKVGEKFIRHGWYEYVKTKKVKRGVILGFSLSFPMERLFVSFLNR